MRYAIAGLLAAAASASVWAHVGVHPEGGFGPGFMHPIFGLDHLLVMLAAIAWAVRVAGPRRAIVPATIIGTMALVGWLVATL